MGKLDRLQLPVPGLIDEAIGVPPTTTITSPGASANGDFEPSISTHAPPRSTMWKWARFPAANAMAQGATSSERQNRRERSPSVPNTSASTSKPASSGPVSAVSAS